MTFKNFFSDKRILITGITGFKGSWLASWLDLLDGRVHGIGLPPNTKPSLFKVLNINSFVEYQQLNIRNQKLLSEYISKIQPEIIFHLAAQPLVLDSYKFPLKTIQTNILGTANLLYSINKYYETFKKPCTVIVITSDKCYENIESHISYREEDPLGGHDIYSMSKASKELLVSSWQRSFFSKFKKNKIYIATCRSGNVIGGGDWAKDRIVPDTIRSIINKKVVKLRHPESTRPWQHVLEPLSGYLQVAMYLHKNKFNKFNIKQNWNFGPNLHSENTVSNLYENILKIWGINNINYNYYKTNNYDLKLLKLSIDKAWNYLKWQPTWNYFETVKKTVDWYKLCNDSDNNSLTMQKFTKLQIQEYTNDAKSKKIEWSF